MACGSQSLKYLLSGPLHKEGPILYSKTPVLEQFQEVCPDK